MTIKEQIAILPTGRTIITNRDKGALSSEFEMNDLKALADSHARLLKVAKELYDFAEVTGWNDSYLSDGEVSEFRAAIAEAEKL